MAEPLNLVDIHATATVLASGSRGGMTDRRGMWRDFGLDVQRLVTEYTAIEARHRDVMTSICKVVELLPRVSSREWWDAVDQLAAHCLPGNLNLPEGQPETSSVTHVQDREDAAV